LGLACLIAALGAGCTPGGQHGLPPTDAPSAPAESSASSPPAADPSSSSSPTGDGNGPAKPDPLSCRTLAAELTLEQRIGQLFMAGTSTEGMSDAEAEQFSELKVGAVIPLGNSTAGQDAIVDVTDAIRDRVQEQHDIEVLIAADQEGGQVQRLAGPGFGDMPSAVEQAEMSNRELRSAAQDWGAELRDAGIDANLAPVSDVVPEELGSDNEPIGALDRGYGADVDQVAEKNVAFIRGMHDAGIATSVKHFPGIGKIRGNTDFSTDVLDRTTTEGDDDLGGFAAGIEAGTEMVMMSSATYQRIDPDRPATYSTKIISGMLRADLGFGGVVISDALEGEALSAVPTRRRALQFIRAGGDLAIVGQPDAVAPMVRGVRSAAKDDAELQKLIMDASTRVLELKSRQGLADCKP
jgi:beta-N-acetylhexosaminidase